MAIKGIKTLKERAAMTLTQEKAERAFSELESINSVIMRWDKTGIVTWLNSFGMNLFGFDNKDIIGKHIVGSIIPDEGDVAEGLKVMIDEILDQPMKYIDNENLNSKANGDLIWMLWRNKPILDESGNLKEILSVGVDIPGRKKMEEELEDKTNMLEQLSGKLAKYLSPQICRSIFSGEQEVAIASRRKKLTIFFSDIVNFTETTDSLEPEELSNVLNRYLTEMTNIALRYGATIDKYIGDAILIFFGDPETKGPREDALACVEMAVAMQRRMPELVQEWKDQGLERPFQIRVGISTGFCTVGNFGSDDRMDYTIIGNQVNLAARLESSARSNSILIAHETFSLVKNSIKAEEQEPLTVKGFDKPVHCYEVTGTYDDLAQEGSVIRRDEDGLKILVDLDEKDKKTAINVLEEVIEELKGRSE